MPYDVLTFPPHAQPWRAVRSVVVRVSTSVKDKAKRKAIATKVRSPCGCGSLRSCVPLLAPPRVSPEVARLSGGIFRIIKHSTPPENNATISKAWPDSRIAPGDNPCTSWRSGAHPSESQSDEALTAHDGPSDRPPLPLDIRGRHWQRSSSPHRRPSGSRPNLCGMIGRRLSNNKQLAGK